MTKFITRIELFGAPTHGVYQSLNAAMHAAKFSSTVTLIGISYLLPKGEFIWEGAETTNAVEALAVETALPVWQDFAVMVTKTESRIGFHNLKPESN